MLILKDEAEFPFDGCVVALGMFDGVHIGHQRLIRTAVETAARLGVCSVVDTFDTHPLKVLCPERAPVQLLSNDERTEKIRRLGADVLVMRPFTAEYAAQPPEVFLERLCERLHPKQIVVGYNYTFGRKGSGDTALMRRLGEAMGFGVTMLAPVTAGEETVSSTRIRRLLSEGRITEAEALLAME